MSDQIIDTLEAVQRPQIARLQARAEAAEAEVARLREALTETERAVKRCPWRAHDHALSMARAALAPREAARGD